MASAGIAVTLSGATAAHSSFRSSEIDGCGVAMRAIYPTVRDRLPFPPTFYPYMSGIYGLWQRDGRPIVPEQVAAMADSLRHRGLDGNFAWSGGNLALGCQLTRITPESFREK